MGIPVLLWLGPRGRIRILGFNGRWFPKTSLKQSQKASFENIWVPTVRMDVLFFSHVAGLSTCLGWSVSWSMSELGRLIDLHKAFNTFWYWWVIQHLKWLVSAWWEQNQNQWLCVYNPKYAIWRNFEKFIDLKKVFDKVDCHKRSKSIWGFLH